MTRKSHSWSCVALLAMWGLSLRVVPGADDSQGLFEFGFRGPALIEAHPGATAGTLYALTLSHVGGGTGAMGWSYGVIVDGAELVGAGDGITYLAGCPRMSTDASDLFAIGYSEVRWVLPQGASTGECEGRRAIVGSMVLSLTSGQTLPVRETSTVAHVCVEVEGNDEESEFVLRFVDGCAESQPVFCCVVQAGTTRTVGKGTKTVEVKPALSFLRGDTNADERVDISDPIRTLMFLFLGAAAPPCLDAADATDDGAIDLSDAVLTLNDFFTVDTTIPTPGPFACGPDPTDDGLSCVAYSACSASLDFD